MTKVNGALTKVYLDNKLKDFVTKLYLDRRLGEFGKKFKDELYEIKDEIVGEIKAMREEFDTHQYSHTRINDDLQDHDQRMSKLESSQKS